MKKTGFIGWRGMVGSVLMDRMREENDFAHIEPIFFTTSQAGQAAPDVGVETPLLQSAFDIDALAQMDHGITHFLTSLISARLILEQANSYRPSLSGISFRRGCHSPRSIASEKRARMSCHASGLAF